jgi:hypothetical protein
MLGDGLDLFAVGRHRCLKCRRKIRHAHPVERRHSTVGSRPLLDQRMRGCGGGGKGELGHQDQGACGAAKGFVHRHRSPVFYCVQAPTPRFLECGGEEGRDRIGPTGSGSAGNGARHGA